MFSTKAKNRGKQFARLCLELKITPINKVDKVDKKIHLANKVFLDFGEPA